MGMQQNDGDTEPGSVYAWLCPDRTGTVGVIAAPIAGAFLALADTDLERAKKMRLFAEKEARSRGFPAELVKFTRDETLLTVEP